MLGTSLVFALCVVHVRAIAEVVTVQTTYGPVQGQTITLNDGSKVNSFYGIPFAKPPIGDLRWKKPVDPESWTEPMAGNVLPPACPQGVAGLIWVSHPLWKNYDEDCLYLNIFTPTNMTKKHPVMIWYHGGAFSVSANIQYPGHFFAQRDVVLVVPNYRLGALGFMSTMDDGLRGNWGLHDQIKAMKFVHDNIDKFGGDKDKVTLFGQSAGAASTALHLIIPESWPYFNQVIPMSGSEIAFWAVEGPEHEPENYTRQVAEKFNCSESNSTAMMQCMRNIHWNTLQQNQGFKCKDGFYCLGFVPVVDDDLIKDKPLALRAQGRFKNCSMMAGLLTTDGSLYTIALIPESLEGGFNRTQFETILRGLVDMFAAQIVNGTVEDVYRALLWYYAPHPYLEDLDLNRDAFNEMVTDVGFGYHSEISIRYHAEAGNDVYFYRYGYLSDLAYDLGVIPEWMGVFHSAEIPYTFQWPLMRANRAAAFDSGIILDLLEWNELDLQFSDYMCDLWTNFAKYGNPTPNPVKAPGNNTDTVWPVYNTTTFHYLLIEKEIKALTGYKSRNHALWADFLDYLARLNFLPDPIKRRKPSKSVNSEEFNSRVTDFLVDFAKKARAATMQDKQKKRSGKGRN